MEEAQRLRDRGLTYLSVARELGLEQNTVYHYLKRRQSGKPKPCKACGKEFHAFRSGMKFCSHSCYLGQLKGPKNPRYKHGRSCGTTDRRYQREFKVKAEQTECCRSCDTPGPLHAHHAVPRSLAPAGKYDDRNCLPLCPSCHSLWHRGTRIIPRDMFTADEWAFITTLVGPTWLDKRYPESAQSVVPRCKRGHPYSGDNLRITADGSKRCRACTNLRAARYRAAKAAA